jgi:hypothetical protein
MPDTIAGFPVQIIKQGRLFIAYSHKLDLSTTGKSEKEATDHFGTIVKIFEKDATKKNGLDNALTDLGWTRKQKRWAPPVTAG